MKAKEFNVTFEVKNGVRVAVRGSVDWNENEIVVIQTDDGEIEMYKYQATHLAEAILMAVKALG